MRARNNALISLNGLNIYTPLKYDIISSSETSLAWKSWKFNAGLWRDDVYTQRLKFFDIYSLGPNTISESRSAVHHYHHH